MEGTINKNYLTVNVLVEFINLYADIEGLEIANLDDLPAYEDEQDERLEPFTAVFNELDELNIELHTLDIQTPSDLLMLYFTYYNMGA